MNKNTVVLADSSYTIRRIVELSFQEEDIELVSFENGLNLKDKLLELKPQVVLVDIKLPDCNGYEICKFINESDTLKTAKVFLMKGGFESIDEDLLKNLRYMDIITKPFDSNALVNTIKDLLEKKKTDAKVKKIPSTLPEDLPGIEGLGEPGEEISFSDIKEEIEIGKATPIDNKMDEEILRDDVLPSEEKTQGSPPPEKDSLKFESIEEIENPFKDEKNLEEEEREVKKNIKEQEAELEIASLTQEEINIKKIMEKKTGKIKPDALGPDEESEETEEDDTSDRLEDSLEAPEDKELDIKEDQFPSKTLEPRESEQHEELEMNEISEEIEKVGIIEEKSELDLDLKTDEPESLEAKIKKQAADIIGKKVANKEIDLQKEEILHKVEDSLTIAIKEILWEIVPPLAEKVIKEEIKKIKSEIDNSAD